MASFKSIRSEIYDREERKQQYQSFIRGLNAYDRHKKFVKDYVSYYGDERPSVEKLPIKTDQDTLREGYRFIRTEEDDLDTSWEQRLVKRYYNKLFKEYCIADMSKYKSGKIGLRWRTEKEVESGKGQFVCGNKHCDEKDDMASYEVNFVYFEAGESKQALVKLVACIRCAEKLHYHRRKEREELERKEKEESDRKRERGATEDEYIDSESDSSANSDRKRKHRRLSEYGISEGRGEKRKRRSYERGATEDEHKDSESDCSARIDRRRKHSRLSEDARSEGRGEKRKIRSYERSRESLNVNGTTYKYTEDEHNNSESDCAENSDRSRKHRRLSKDGRSEGRGEKRKRRSHERSRERSNVKDSTDKSPDTRDSHKKGKGKVVTAQDGSSGNKDDDETFNEFLEGMFP